MRDLHIRLSVSLCKACLILDILINCALLIVVTRQACGHMIFDFS